MTKILPCLNLVITAHLETNGLKKEKANRLFAQSVAMNEAKA